MTELAFVTIASNNYLHFARTLMQSVAQQHPEAQRYCVIVDRDMGPASELASEFRAIELGDLGLPDGDDFLFQYNILELNTAVKPWAMQHVLDLGHRKVIYCDPDIHLYRPMTEALETIGSDADIVVTPHLLSPIDDDMKPGELDIRRAGTYNLGFCGVSESQNSRNFLKWWQRKLRYDCIIAHDQGMFVDQSWIDLVPGLFPRVSILRHAGYNVAYWNIAQRPMSRDGDKVYVSGEPLVFFHFSGLNPEAPQSISKHQNRFTLDALSEATASLFNAYCQRVVANGMEHFRKLAYGFGCFDYGTPITDADRANFRASRKLGGRGEAAPFSSNHPIASSRPRRVHIPALDETYNYLLGREPDESGISYYLSSCRSKLDHLRFAYSVGTSPEARQTPGWRRRLLSWPLRRVLMVHHPLGNRGAIKAPMQDMPTTTRISIYRGLQAAEPESAENGIWVGPTLDLPTGQFTKGHLRIRGRVDIEFLKRGGAKEGQQLEVHVAGVMLHRATMVQSGDFEIDAMLGPDAFAGAGQWEIHARSHTIPKNAGINDDTRELAWRVQSISIDGRILIDAARSPVTLPVQQLIPSPGFNLVGYLSAELGLGEAARALAGACVAQGVRFGAIDVGFQSSNLQRDTRIKGQATDRRFPIDLIYVNADQTVATTAYLDDAGHPRGYRIGFWHWEQQRLPDSAVAAFARVDEVWTPSTFVQDAVAATSPVPVVKIPHAIEVTVSPGVSRGDFGLPTDKTVALAMWDFHSYNLRKNPEAAVQAFRIATRGRNDAALVIKSINGNHYPEALAELKAGVSDLPNVIFIDEFLTRQQTWDLQACCDILISLHRAEGFGLAPAEMMYLGKVVVATGWSGNMDFMTAENSFPVRYVLKPLAKSHGVYQAGLNWAEADVEHAADCIRRLLESAALRQQIGLRAAQDIRRQLSPQAVGALVKERLTMLAVWHPRLRG